MGMQCRVYIIITILLWPFIGFNQPGFKQYTVKNGLTQNAVTAIFKDSKGFVWMGTQDGLNRFDGVTFTHYKHHNLDTTSISDQYITAIAEDGAGDIWVGTRNGLNRLDVQKGIFERIHLNPSKKQVIQYVFEQLFTLGNGHLAIVVENQVYLWDHRRKQFKQLSVKASTTSSFTANQQFVWQYLNGWFYQYDPTSGKLLQQLNLTNKQDNFFQATKIYHNKTNIIWVVNETVESKPVIKLFDTKTQGWLKDSLVLNEKINQINFDNQNNAWIASISGMIKVDEQLKPIFWKADQLPEALNQSNAVLNSYHDASGLVWIGFANNGAILYNPAASSFALIQPKQKRETVFAYAQDSLGYEWIAAVSGLYKRHPSTNQMQLVIPKKIRALTAGNDGIVWAAFENEGLYKILPDRQPVLVASVQNKRLTDHTIFHLNIDAKNNHLFIATKSGLYMLNVQNEQIIAYTAQAISAAQKITGSYVLHSFTDHLSRTWVSTNAGIDVLDQFGKRLFFYATDNDQSQYIKRTIVTGCTEDRLGQIWIATLSNGVYKWKNGQFTHYDQTNGLSGNIVIGIMADATNRIWVATTTGMNIIDQDKKQIDAITEQNGIPASDFLLGSFTKNNAGQLLLGSSEGLVVIHPAKVHPTVHQLNCSIVQAAINYSPVAIAKHFQLYADDKSISFEIAAPSFINADKVIYQYRCFGLVDKWVTIGANNKRFGFTNLPFKKLTLEIRAAENLAQLSNANIAQYTIYRQPPFWQNWYFLVPAIGAVLVCIILFIRFLTKRKLQRQLQEAAIQQGIYKERERISRDLHDHLGAYAAAIKSNIVQLEKMDAHTNDTMFQLKGNAEDMVNALRETIWVMQYQQISMTALSDRFKNLVNRIAPNYPSTQINVKAQLMNEKMLSPGESIHLLRIMQEALTNALKHAQCSQIDIEMIINNPVLVSIQDNGIGFNLNDGANGYGLQNIKDRAAEAGLTLDIRSEMGKGTRISLRF